MAILGVWKILGAARRSLPDSLRRYHVDYIDAAKGEETRRRRIEKAVANFRAGHKR